MKSPGHRANILRKEFTQVGVSSGGTYRQDGHTDNDLTVYPSNFGRPR
jgi:uncharacterized protein YkwD